MRVLTTNNKTSWDSGVSETLFVYKDRKVNALKILIVEDNILKFSKIRRVLNDLCHAEIEHVEALEPAKKMFIEALNKNEFYDLVVTDVHFPNEKNGSEVADAGFQLIEYVQEKRPEQPIIVCSSCHRVPFAWRVPNAPRHARREKTLIPKVVDAQVT